MKRILIIFSVLSLKGAFSQVANPLPYTNTKVSYIRTWEALMPWQNSDSLANRPVQDVRQTTQYFDGLGMPIQTIGKQESPSQKDMIACITYDQFGREQYKFLPFTSNVVQAGDITNDGDFKFDPFRQDSVFSKNQYPGESYFYSQANFEASPMNRVLNSYPAGGSWVGSSRGTAAQYLNDASTDSVQQWNIKFLAGSLPVTAGAYPAGKLDKTITTDENGHQTIEYKDMSGHIVLKKIQLSASPGTAHVGWLNTYYVYDSLENLRFVISPRAVELINTSSINWAISQGIADELCFRYEYDYRNRMAIKKIPGAGELWMIYDSRDRVALSQDANLRTSNQWIFTKYDALNRQVMTGLYTDNSHLAQSSMQSYLNSAGMGLYETYSAGAFPQYSMTNSFPSATSANLLMVVYYDDYGWVSGSGTSLSSTLDVSGSSNFLTGSNTAFPYPRAVAQSTQIYGLATGRIEKVIETASQYTYAVSFYDDHNRVIQTQSINYTGGKDIITVQYDFSGKIIRDFLQHQKNGNTVQNHTVLTKMDYDQALRVKHIYKNIDNAASDQLIDSATYDELGQLKAKYLGNNIDSLVYDYNIRGWLTGINKNYVAGTATHYFGMELGYDKNASVAIGNTYTTPEYNGNIEGTVWKTAGSGVNRKYDFVYDGPNRLTAANFAQYNGTGFDVSAGINFSVSNLAYDANGNILSMAQKGFMLGGSNFIDQLHYTYQSNSNKLSQVYDTADNQASLLGDLHYNSSTKQATDYAYDGNGNLTLDNNKAISAIHYNYLNLPDSIVFTSKGYIKYVYDATGGKLQKVTVDNTGSKKTVTTYLDGFVYQNTSSIAGSGTDTLQFIAHEEGQARWAFHKYTTGTTAYKLEYDFFEKDHLGNTRMVLTQQRDTANYLASMEAAYRTTESQLFANITTTAFARASVAGYPASTTITNPNDSVSKVDYNGTTGQKMGPSLLLKVMSGDTVSVAVQSYYNTSTATVTNSSFSDVLNSLAAGLVGTATGGAEGTISGFTASTSPVYVGLNSFLPANDPALPAGYPKAYLNWVFLDDQFNYVSSSSGSVPAAGSSHPAATLNNIAPGSPLNIVKNGYLYIWVSNETQGWDVFFDNLSVQHKQGPVLEENHYYPFGLTMAGISDKAIKANYLENKRKFNKGSEIQNKEFNDGSGLDWYSTQFRMYDPQIGRWNVIDPKPTDEESPYAAMKNNPILNNDPLGDYAVYYNTQGQVLYRLNDGHKRITPTIISDKNMKAFFATIINKRATIKGLNKFGTVYDTKAFSKFYDDNHHVNASYVGNYDVNKISNLRIDNKPADKNILKSEVAGNTVLKNGMITVGNNAPAVLGNLFGGDPDKAGQELGKVGNIHLHPFDHETKVNFSYQPDPRFGLFDSPSLTVHGGTVSYPEDYNQAKRFPSEYRQVMVDSKFIYLYNSNASETIKIPRQ